MNVSDALYPAIVVITLFLAGLITMAQTEDISKSKQQNINKPDANQAYALPNKTSNLKGLPPTTLVTAEVVPL